MNTKITSQSTRHHPSKSKLLWRAVRERPIASLRVGTPLAHDDQDEFQQTSDQPDRIEIESSSIELLYRATVTTTTMTIANSASGSDNAFELRDFDVLAVCGQCSMCILRLLSCDAIGIEGD